MELFSRPVIQTDAETDLYGYKSNSDPQITFGDCGGIQVPSLS